MFISGSIILLILSYKLGIAKTIELANENKKLTQELVLVENMPKKLATLKRKNTYYQDLLDNYQLSGNSLQNSLLKTINRLSDSLNLKLVDFHEPHTLEENGLLQKTYMFSLQGSFINIQGLVYQLEQKTKFGEVINIHFERKKNYKLDKYFLEAKVMLLSFE